jgi:adenine-specific DNA-methyltransferase
VVLSFSNEGFHDLDAVAALLARRGYVAALAVDAPRHVGARIGIHDPNGRRVGTVSHLRTTEAVFVCGPDRAVTERALDGSMPVAI